MSDVHTCSYSCDRPGCMKAQRDELLKQVEEQREAIALLVEKMGIEGYGTLAIAAAIRKGDA